MEPMTAVGYAVLVVVIAIVRLIRFKMYLAYLERAGARSRTALAAAADAASRYPSDGGSLGRVAEKLLRGR